MIITLDEAREVNTDVTQLELNGLETAIRTIANNDFRIDKVKFNVESFNGNVITVDKPVVGIKAGDTIQITESVVDDGLQVVVAVGGNQITVKGNLNDHTRKTFITLVKYPDDIKSGIIKLLKYDLDMIGKTGVKSRTISRMSETYFDTAETINGYPEHLMAFLQPHMKMRWH